MGSRTWRGGLGASGHLWDGLLIVAGAVFLTGCQTTIGSGEIPGTKGYYPAEFAGNLTSVSGSGNASFLRRQPDCSLTLIDGALTVSTNSFGLSSLVSVPNYQLALHTNAFLQTTPNRFLAGCPDPTIGLPSRSVMYGGLTSQGLLFGAGALGVLNGPSPNALGGALLSGSQVAVQSLTTYAVDHFSAGTLAGDLNKDGVNDMVSVNRGSITVLLANPDGTLQSGVNYDLPLTAVTAASGVIDDVNGDGNLDVVVATDGTSAGIAGHQVWVFLGNGNGTLQNPLSFSATQSALGAITGDFNRDGRKDLVTGTGQVFLGHGDGTFALLPQSAFTPPNDLGALLPENLAAGDFNHDGNPDLAAAYGLSIWIYLGRGDGTFTPGLSYASNGNTDLLATDIDGDGNLDIYAGLGNGGIFGRGLQTAATQGSGYVLMGNGDGTFQGAPQTPFSFLLGAGDGVGGPGILQSGSGNMADLNNDRKLDAIAFVQNAGAVSLASYLGRGDGTFSTGPSQQISPFTYKGQQVRVNNIGSLAIADFNGDQIPDVVYMEGLQPTGPVGYYVATGKGDGSFNAPVFIPAPSFYADKQDYGEVLIDVTSADFNHDGKADLLYWVADADYRSNGTINPIHEVVIQLGNGDGTFQAAILVPLSAGTSPYTSTAANTVPSLIADVNGDHIPDLLVLQYTGQLYQGTGSFAGTQLAVYLGNGDGTFKAPSMAPAADNPAGVLLADMNGDGKPDLVTSGVFYGATYVTNASEVAVSLGNGDGTFQTATIYSQLFSTSKPYLNVNLASGNLVAADFNGDGRADVVFGQDVYFGNGDGTLQTSTGTQGAQILTIGGNGSAFAADFNGDGKPDLLWGNALLANKYGAAPVLAITETHTGNFTTGQAGATYTVTVSNFAGSPATSGAVTVSETAPAGLTLVSMTGAGWTCAAGSTTCTRSDSLAGGASFPPITVTVNVAANASSPLVNVVSVSGGGSVASSAVDSATITLAPVLSITKTHTGNFTAGQSLANYSVTVTNSGNAATSGTVTVTDNLPSGLRLVSMLGAGWTCASGGTTCTRSDSRQPGVAYPAINVAVSVAANAASPQVNSASVSGGGSATATATDSTIITGGTVTGGMALYPVTPCRVADTRNAAGAFGGPILNGGSTRTFAVPAGTCGIPAAAQAYSLNITAVPPGALGYITAWPTGQAQPLVSTLNSSNGAVIANAAIVPAGTNGAVNIFASDATHVILDINGYFALPGGAGALAFYPATPCRVADTRGANGAFGGPPLGAGATRNFTVPASTCGIPATAQAYSLNMTVVPPGPLLYLSTWPTGQPQPLVSTLNALQGQIAANAAIVPAGQGGAISVFVSDASNVIVDVNGYFAPPGSPGALYFYPVTPCRVADTRNATGTFGGPSIGSGATRTFPIPASACGLPAAAQAYSLNMTVVPPGPLLYLSTWPAGQALPVVSTLNDLQGLVVANAAIVPAGASGGISVFVSDGTNLIIDVNGYFGQ